MYISNFSRAEDRYRRSRGEILRNDSKAKAISSIVQEIENPNTPKERKKLLQNQYNDFLYNRNKPYQRRMTEKVNTSLSSNTPTSPKLKLKHLLVGSSLIGSGLTGYGLYKYYKNKQK